ncbi:hypothetical protein SAMN05192563_10198 [Paraburkholderia aspalathi]|uniref:Uncharacterized protein n=1 Tax=Paraburkholderia aspalathi TaxID=1324617 RepID=A0A1I7EFR5_9BURK|nr:hypothetical protein SAMN05192563_10198 [Paraburkholderia aspalathi]
MSKTIHIEVPGLDARTAHRLAIATLTHYGFACSGGATTKQSRGTARVKIVARHCSNDHEGAARLAACALPTGTRVGIDHRNPFH